MNQEYRMIAKTFYTVFGDKNVDAMAPYLHPEVQLITPLSKLQGKEAYLEAAKHFISFFKTLTIRLVFSDETHALVVYDFECLDPIGNISASVLLTFQDTLISRIEIFHDTAPFQKVREDLLA